MRRPTVFAVVFLALVLSPLARAQSASFQIARHGHAVGTASFTFSATPQGYSSTSLVRIAMQGLDYALSKEEQLTSANQLVHVRLSAVINGSAVELVAKPDAAQLLLNISANGRSTTTRLPAHAAAVLLPDFDPGALQTLLALAVEHNNRDLWAMVPKQSGSMDAVQLATYADLQGTLNGKPITVHHLVATIAGATTQLFCDAQDQLLQAELPQDGFALVRNGFKLQPPSKAPAPPPSPAPQPQTSPAH